ncbi:MAG: hypothetical protein E7A85_00195 [Anaerococcus sp.]|jgi:hypothetical protein|nr:hypothetical protein [Anaerococcus sp.]DAM67760.1 MAG TPA: Minor capsid protein from bacteriophage [Caudoviricetes sp.]
MKAIIESVREYFLECPYLEDEARLNIDFLGDDPIEYGIYSEPSNQLIKRYVDGDELKQFNFIFTTRTAMSGDLVTQLENSAFFDKLIDWVYQQNKNKNYPKIEGNRHPIKLEILSNGYVSSSNVDTAVYQIQMSLRYMEVMI